MNICISAISLITNKSIKEIIINQRQLILIIRIIIINKVIITLGIISTQRSTMKEIFISKEPLLVMCLPNNLFKFSYSFWIHCMKIRCISLYKSVFKASIGRTFFKSCWLLSSFENIFHFPSKKQLLSLLSYTLNLLLGESFLH